ncbi:hypothetical protein [Saccharomonospora cyanea]|uniref:Uncharacterized protein n=1 Tax=Saccharomonospora cyanea NA-134 TaxID=882082 RepID=H5XMH8_9PSEU|nr:hypothetical protein [Saccharomonospora cyanea]EHR59927.1 hypothetical protein SaccyDRAFT_1014 [Saccharomonospora cyanea NA-134]
MILRDRELLVRMSKVNRCLGIVVAEAMARQHDGGLPPQPLREIGQALRSLADDLITRAEEIESRLAIEVAPQC